MPIYEFICDSCEQKYEEQKKVGDFKSNCPICGKETRKIVSAANFTVNGSTNRPVDTVIGEMAEKRWTEIDENRKKRIKDNYGTISEKEAKEREGKRVAKVLDKQGKAVEIIDKAKKEAGITKSDELKHAIGGGNA